MSRQASCKLCGSAFVCDNGMWSTTCTCAKDRPTELAAANGERHRVSYLTVLQAYNLNVACKPIAMWGYGTFHVGSSLTRHDYRDVDLRCMLDDDEWVRMFQGRDGGKKLFFLNAAISEWLAARSGLPIDFQFQQASKANEEFHGPRNAVGH